MKFTYRMTKEGSGWLADCVECEAMGSGATPDEAVESLRTSLEQRMLRADAVAPPPEEVHATIQLALSVEPTTRDSLDLGGPGG